MDDIEQLIDVIATKVSASNLPDVEKADIMAQLSVGMHRLVWPILLAHVPEDVLKEAVKKKTLSVDEYSTIIRGAFATPGIAKEMHDELKSALEEVDTLITKSLS